MISKSFSLSIMILLAIILVIVLSAAGCSTQDAVTSAAQVGSQPGQNSPACLTSREAMNSVDKTACVEFFIGNPSQYQNIVYLNEMADFRKGFQAVILPESAANFNNPVSTYRNKTVRVNGLIVEYDGHPGIIIKTPSDITIVK